MARDKICIRRVRGIDDPKDEHRTAWKFKGILEDSKIYVCLCIFHADRVSIRVSCVAFINFNGESGFPLSTFFVDNPVGTRSLAV